MKKRKFILGCSLVALTAIPVLTGCKKKKDDEEPDVFSFSIDIESGRNELENAPGVKDKIVIYTNRVDAESRQYTYTSSQPSIAEIDDHGVITPKGVGQVSFTVKELNSGKVAQLVNPIRIVPEAKLASGGRNYSSQAKRADGTSPRTEILAKLEKYAMDTHLTGITLFDNGGYVKYSKRVGQLPADEYISGYGFGLLREGGPITGKLKDGTPKMSYYHTSISQDPANINAMNASGSQISDLSSYITSSYFSTKLAANKKSYEWYPVLAKEKINKPVVGASGNIESWEENADQTRPIPMEKPNDLKMYKKWRIYLKTGASDGLTYTYLGNKGEFNNRPVELEDYEFAYKLLLTGKNGLSRGAEMAGDTSYGIKGALSFYNATLNEENQEKIDNTWNSMKEGNALGIHTGTDAYDNKYIELELVNPIDEFTAMYTLSSSLVSPLPRAFLEAIGGGSVITGAANYGAFKGGIVNNTICCGPYTLEEWIRDQAIVFKRNDNWFEHKDGFYQIDGIYNQVIDSSNDIEAVYSQFQDNILDVCGIPSTKIEIESKLDGVKQTKGDSTFKLNVNSCTQAQWNELFGPNGSINKGSHWDVKPWMSNKNFLNGLFYSINRKEFATKRGVQPSINYFSDAYLDDAEGGHSYNKTPEHEQAVSSYHTVVKNNLGEETYNDYGFNYDKAVNSFKTAVNQLTSSYQLVKGTKEKPTDISIEICWMYPTDDTEYGEDIASYIEKAFNDNKVSNGTVRLTVKNTHVDYWEDVYNERMMKGQFDLGFGAISGNTLNPLNFLEVLKSDNSSSFTLNWGNDTSKVDPIHPIYLTNPDTGENEKWSFDALWEVADHGGIIQNGVKEKAIRNCWKKTPVSLTTGKGINTLKDGFKIDIPVDFIEVDGAVFDLSRVTIFADGVGYIDIDDAVLTKKPGEPDIVTATVSKETAASINTQIYENVYANDGTDKNKDENKWKLNPFLADKYHDNKGNGNWHIEVWYTMKLGGGQPTENSVYVKTSESAQD